VKNIFVFVMENMFVTPCWTNWCDRGGFI